MPNTKMGNIFPAMTAAFVEQEITTRINKILREAHQDKSSCIKIINKKTDIKNTTIKRWYTGRNPPSSAHLMILALHYPAVLKMILDVSGYGYLIPHVAPDSMTDTDDAKNAPDPFPDVEKNVTLNVTIKSKAANLNERQVWFLENLKTGQNITARDICRQWPDGLRTARRDISVLKELNLIRRAGGKKTGRYEII